MYDEYFIEDSGAIFNGPRTKNRTLVTPLSAERSTIELFAVIMVPKVGLEPTVWNTDLQDRCNRRYATSA